MPLRTGDRLGAYEILGLLGHGAMGEVYRARDTRLGRDVAVKVLPSAFANDPDRLSRLEREARLISQVSHPNICTLFDIVEEHNTPSLVFELIEGETLQQRLLRGPMPLVEALRCGSGIAAALEAAHGKDIVHRDLKPSNIKLTAAGAIKVLDFGVAKLARDAGADGGAPDLTLTLGGTKEGALVGTVAYVSPEQAMGDRVDRRSDIWAFGCLLYEMLTAQRAFPGVAVADTLGAVMRGDPDWTALPAGTPPALHTLLRRCLEKDRGRRLADIADARLEIEDLLSAPSTRTAIPGSTGAPPVAASQPRRGRLVVVLAFLAGVVFATAIARLLFNAPPPAPPAAAESRETTATSSAVPPSPSTVPPSSTAVEAAPDRSTKSAPPREVVPPLIELPDGVAWPRTMENSAPNTILAMSPDGRLIAFSARDDDGTALWLRALTLNETWRLPGTDGGISPFWSPDSASIGFFAERRLKRLDLNGLGSTSRDVARVAAPAALAEVGDQRGGTWAPGGTIVFAPFPAELKRVSANGGEVSSLTSFEGNESHHVRPQFFPGTRQLLYRVSSPNSRRIPFYVGSLDSGDRKLIATLDTGSLVYSRGHLLFVQDNVLMAQPFDLKNMAVAGPPRPVVSNVLASAGSRPRFGVFSASQTGRLVYLSQDGDPDHPMNLVANWDTPAR